MTRDEAMAIQKISGIHMFVSDEPGRRPKSIEPGATPKGFGHVVAVRGCHNPDDARTLIYRAERWGRMSEDDRDLLLEEEPTEYGLLKVAFNKVTNV